MAKVFVGQMFANKDMAKVAVAGQTANLGPQHAKGAILNAANGVGNLIIESWPATAGVKLLLAGVQVRSTTSAMVITKHIVIHQSAAPRRLCPSLAQNAKLRGRQKCPPSVLAQRHLAVWIARQLFVAMQRAALVCLGHTKA